MKKKIELIVIGLFCWIIMLMSCTSRQNRKIKQKDSIIYYTIKTGIDDDGNWLYIKQRDTLIYYSESDVIFWCPTEEEQELYEKDKYYEYEQSDDGYFMTEAWTLVAECGYKTITNLNSSIGFIIGKDTVMLHKKDFLDDRGWFKWKIILFDAKSKPIVATPYDVAVGVYSDFFNNSK